MVTVVKHEPHPSVVKEVICRKCGATLNYIPMDIKKEVNTDYTGDKDISYHIVCPPCNNKVSVKGY